ncbi:ATP-binding protein [Neorhizobium huautlense]|uniref:ATP-binding protein n=1 Tax=Neorhizobium huautlense TaxID=67774 RepID=UPI000CF8E93F|nr:ATP-binding protein [Neorhizobium huautlense]
MTKTAEELRAIRIQEDRRFVELPAIKSLRNRLNEFYEHAQDCLGGGGSRRRLFAVIGESGTGKSTALMQALNEMDGLRPYKGENGELRIPFVHVEVSKTSTNKDVAVQLLKQLGQDADRNAKEDLLYETLKTQLREAGTLLLHIEEAQHLQKGGTAKAVRNLQDRFKSLLVIPDWPLHLILSGVEELSELFMGDQQLANRSLVMRFEPLKFPGDISLAKTILNDVAFENCKLKLEKSLETDDFLGRLIQSTGGGAGTMIEMVRSASYKALSKGHAKLDPKDFEFVYSRTSGSLPQDNIITAKNWGNIDRANALADLAPTKDKPKHSKKVKGGKE